MANFSETIPIPEDQITTLPRKNISFSNSSIATSIIYPFLPGTPISAVSPPAVVSLTNGYLKPFLSSPLSLPPSFNSYLCQQFTPLIPLTNSLSNISTPVHAPIINAIPSSTPYYISKHISPTSVADIPLPESPPSSPLHTPTNAPADTTHNDTANRNKGFSIASILASVREEGRESPTEVTSPTPLSHPVLTGKKRRASQLDGCEVPTPSKSAKATPLKETTSLPDTNSNQLLLNLPLAPPDPRDTCPTSNATSSTDSGIHISSNSGTSTPSSIPSTQIQATSLASQLVARDEHAHIQQLKRLLSEKWNAMTIASPDEDGDTLLHLAIANEKPDLVNRYVRMLSSHSFKLDLKNHLRQTPLHVAVITNQPVIIKYLIAAGANVNVCDRNGDTAVHLACKWGDQHTLRVICESRNYRPDLNAKNFSGLAAMHLAAINNKTECIKVLIENGAEKNIGDGTSGKTALHHAIEGKHFSLITLLVQYDLDVNVPTFSGTTPLQFASGLQEQEIVSYLIHNGTVATKHMPAVQPHDRISARFGPQQTEPTSSTARRSPVNLT